jgi:ribonuclease P protein component
VGVRSNGTETTRFGFSISKRVGNAVVRNRIKRRLREVARSASVEEGFDVVIIARQNAATADFASLEGSVNNLFRRARILQAE